MHRLAHSTRTRIGAAAAAAPAASGYSVGAVVAAFAVGGGVIWFLLGAGFSAPIAVVAASLPGFMALEMADSLIVKGW